MNETFVSNLTARLIELTQHLRFYNKPTGTEIAPQIIGTMLEKKTESCQEAQEYPLVRWVIHQGEFARMSPTPFSVMLDAGIYTDGIIKDGCTDINILVMALGKIVEKPWFKPYKLRNRVSFVLGSPDENSLGIQPHPYYFGRLYLQFVVASGHGG